MTGILCALLCAGLTSKGETGADAPVALFAFNPDEVKVGGEIGCRLNLSMESILHADELNTTFDSNIEVCP